MPSEVKNSSSEASNDVREKASSDVREKACATRRRLLKAGAAAVPLMVTVKSVSAHAAGLTKVSFTDNIGEMAGRKLSNFFDGLGGRDSQDDVIYREVTPQQARDVYASVGCLNQVDQMFPTTADDASSTAANAAVQRIPTSPPSRDDFYSLFENVDFNTFDPGNRYHSTYLNVVLSTACVTSIVTGVPTYAEPYTWDPTSRSFNA